jgi:hypothetical protein
LKQARRRLTYANVMSSIAVFLVLGGATAFAAGHLGKNSVGTKQLKKNSVTAAKIKKYAVAGAKIKNGAVDSSKVKDGSLTGSDINLGTLGTVPSATNAANASNANNANKANKAAQTEQIANIYFAANEGAPKQTILNLGGLTITAVCPGGGGDIELEATTAVDHSLIDFFTAQDGDYEANSDFNVGETFDADDGHNEGTTTDIYSLHYARPGGVNVSIELRDVDPEAGPVFEGTSQQSDCYVGGFAISQ